MELIERRARARRGHVSTSADHTSEARIRYGAGLALYEKALAAGRRRLARCEYAVTPAPAPREDASTRSERDPAYQ